MFVTLWRAAKIVAPIADEHQQSYFEGGVLLILKMLAEYPIATKTTKALPSLHTLEQLRPAPFSQEWFAAIIAGPWVSSYDSEAREPQFPAQTFLNWATSELLVSRDDIIRHLLPPSTAGHEPIAHSNADGVSWSFPQILAWAATRDPAEVARIDSGEHFKKPIKHEPIPAGLVTRPIDQGTGTKPAIDGNLPPRNAMLQSEEGRRKLVGWLAMVTAFEHCKCGAEVTMEQERWESCQCLGRAFDDVRRFAPITAHAIPKYRPQPNYGSFSLEWLEEAFRLEVPRADVLKKWPEDRGAVATAAAEKECAKWLIEAFDSDKEHQKKKSHFCDEALIRFAPRLTKTGFNTRIWPMLAKRYGRDTAGAPRKS